jgi:hypothetical protein
VSAADKIEAAHASNLQERERGRLDLESALRKSNADLTAKCHALGEEVAQLNRERQSDCELVVLRERAEKAEKKLRAIAADACQECRGEGGRDDPEVMDQWYVCRSCAGSGSEDARGRISDLEAELEQLSSLAKVVAVKEERIRELELEHDELDAKLDAIESKAPDGREAEELRHGLEALMRDGVEAYEELGGMPDTYVPTDKLQRLLDDVDARDSLAYLEHVEKELVAKVAELESANAAAMDQLAAEKGRAKVAESSKDEAYRERNQCVAALAKMADSLGYPIGMAQHELSPGQEWDENWRNIIFIDLPTGQVSWHLHISEFPQFHWVGTYSGKWDGHDTPEKYRRLRTLLTTPAPAPVAEAGPVEGERFDDGGPLYGGYTLKAIIEHAARGANVLGSLGVRDLATHLRDTLAELGRVRGAVLSQAYKVEGQYGLDGATVSKLFKAIVEAKL